MVERWRKGGIIGLLAPIFIFVVLALRRQDPFAPKPSVLLEKLVTTRTLPGVKTFVQSLVSADG